MKSSVLILSLLLGLFAISFAQELVSDYPGKLSTWNESCRHDFQLNGVECILVEPPECAPGRPWYWKSRFFGEFAYPEAELLRQGWTIAYTDVVDLFGAPEAVRRFDQFYRFMVSRGYHPAPALAGYSRGGLVAINFASRYPERISSLYLDNAACDFRTWPGAGKYPEGWQNLLAAYGLTEEAAESSPWNPVRRLECLARSRVPVLALCALKDSVVPPERNTLYMERLFQACGGNLTTYYKHDAEHHPHSLVNPGPIVEFVQKNFAACKKATGRLQDVCIPWHPDYRCQYDASRRRLVLTIWQWPEEQQITLSGFSGGTPKAAWLECTGEDEQPLPLVVRPDGWHLFLPAVQPTAGDQRIVIQLRDSLGTALPVERMVSASTLVLDATNGRCAQGVWRWQLYFPRRDSSFLRLPQPSSVPMKITLGSEHSELPPGQQFALFAAVGEGLQTMSLEGFPANFPPRLELSDLFSATIELPLPKGGRLLSKDSGAARWPLPFSVDAEFDVVAEYACTSDCVASCSLGAEPSVLDFRATGDPARFQCLMVGRARMASQEEKSEMALTLAGSEQVSLRRLLLVPAGAEGYGEKPVTGEYVDVAQRERFELPLDHACLVGSNLRVVKGNRSITHWANPAEYIIWPLTNVKPGRYAVKANIGTIETSRLAFNAGGKTLLADVPNLHDYDAFQEFSFGVVEIPRAKEAWLQIYPAPGYHPVNLSGLTLERVDE